MWGSLSFKKILFKIHLFYQPHDSLGYICPGTMEMIWFHFRSSQHSKGWLTNSTATSLFRNSVDVLKFADTVFWGLSAIIRTISSVESTSNPNHLQAEISNLDILNQKYLPGSMLQEGQVGKYVFRSLKICELTLLTVGSKGGDASWSICLTNRCSSLCLAPSVSIIQNGFGFI